MIKIPLFFISSCIIFILLIHIQTVFAVSYDNQTFTSNLKITCTDDEYVTISNCTFDGASLWIEGSCGLVDVSDCIWINQDQSSFTTIMTYGVVNYHRLTFTGPWIDTTNNYSAIVIRSLPGGGWVDNITVTNCPGNCILVESQDIDSVAFGSVMGIKFKNIICSHAKGGMWFFAQDEFYMHLTVDTFWGNDCTFTEHPTHSLGRKFPCILDEIGLNIPRDPGNTEFINIFCNGNSFPFIPQVSIINLE
jgi:hypothetical protein